MGRCTLTLMTTNRKGPAVARSRNRKVTRSAKTGRIAFTIPSTEYGARTGRRTVAPKSGKFSQGTMSAQTLLTGRTYPPPRDAR